MAAGWMARLVREGLRIIRLRAPTERSRLFWRVSLSFVIAYAALLAIVFTGSGSRLKARIIYYGIAWTAKMTAGALWLLGAKGEAHGVLVTSSLTSAVIVYECTAVTPVFIFLAAVLALRCSWRARVLGVVLGVPALLLVNQIRLVSLLYIAYWFPESFEGVHLLVWQPLMVFFTLLLWLLWALKVAYPHATRSA